MKDFTQSTDSNERKLVMIVDDEPDMLSMLGLVIEKKCRCDVVKMTSGLKALEQLQRCSPDVILTDIKMPDLDGLELLKKIRQLDSSVSVVIMTGYGTIDMAVQALKDGAYDFLEKPFDKDVIVRVVNKCLERTSLLRTNQHLQERLDNLSSQQGFIGQSPALKKATDLLVRVADTDATVLIRGESGTGKELAARVLHDLSGRKDKQMVVVNCPALPENILESELFGYSKGAFSGALQERKGLFLEAHGSTILLDEIADIPVSVQTKLLRVLQEKEIQPLGQNKTMKVDVRVVASTNQNLEEKIREGEFREDLFYRLNVVSVVMPNLIEMKEDVPLLIHHFLEKYSLQYQKEDLIVEPEVLQYLYLKKWQGNVRQLQNSIKSLVLLSDGKKIRGSDVNHFDEENPKPAANDTGAGFEDLFGEDFKYAKETAVRRFTMNYLGNILALHGGNVTNAASACGLERQALQRIMRRYGILSTDFKKK